MVFSGMADKGRDDPRLNRSEFGKAAAVGIASIVAGTTYVESHQDYSKDGFDPEIQDALEREGIGKNVHLRIYVGDHYFTERTAKKMEMQGVTVLTGEIKSNPFNSSPSNVEQEPLLKEFFKNLVNLPTVVPELGQMDLRREESEMLLKSFSEKRAVLISDTAPMTASKEASDRVLIGWGLIGSLAYLAEAVRKKNILTEFNQNPSRRNFLKLIFKGGLTLAALPVASAAYLTAENRGVEPPANTEVSYLFSKVFNSAVDVSTKYLEMTSDERIVRGFQSLLSVRNKVMSLNNWYLIESLERNGDVKQSLTGPNGNVEIGFFAGFGHASSKYEFCKGPVKLAEELKSTVTDWLSQYQTDMDNADSSEEKGKVLNYYTGLMKMFNIPELVSNRELNKEGYDQGDHIPTSETPAAIMYRTLIEKVGEEKPKGVIGIYKQLIGNLINDQHRPDGTNKNVSGKIVLSNGEYHNELIAKDPDALKKRFIETNFISPDDLEQIAGEVYPNLYHYDYIGNVTDKNVSVGLAIVRGYPVTFFQKEDTTFISNNP